MENLRAGIIASVIANGLMKKEDGSPFLPTDFMPGESPQKQELDPKLKGDLDLLRFRAVVGQ